MATNQNSTVRPEVQGLTSLLLAAHTNQIASLSPEDALFTIWAMVQVVSRGNPSEPSDPQKQKYPISPISNTFLWIIPSQWDLLNQSFAKDLINLEYDTKAISQYVMINQ